MPFGALGCIPDVVESTDPKTLETKLAESFARQLLANPASQFIELQSSGGGDGAVFQVTLYYSTEEDGNYPPLVDQHVKVVWGSDPKTVLSKLAEFYATVAVDRTTFVEKTSAGAGALWLDIVVYTLGEDLGLVALGLEDADEVAAGTFAAPSAAAELARRERVARRAFGRRSMRDVTVADVAIGWDSKVEPPIGVDTEVAEQRARELHSDLTRRARVAGRAAQKQKGKIDAR
jgi:hypothetical protein